MAGVIDVRVGGKGEGDGEESGGQWVIPAGLRVAVGSKERVDASDG